MYSSLNFYLKRNDGQLIDIKGDVYRVCDILVHRDVQIVAFIKESIRPNILTNRFYSTDKCYITSDYSNEEEESVFKKGFAIVIDDLVESTEEEYKKEKQPHISINCSISLGPEPQIKEFSKFDNKYIKLRLILKNEYKKKFYVPCIAFYKKAETIAALPDKTYIDAKVVIICNKQSESPSLIITGYNKTSN